jgi:hypothetical protein
MTIAELLKAHRDEILAIASATVPAMCGSSGQWLAVMRARTVTWIFWSIWNEEGRSSIMASSRLTWRSSSVET